jgi:hypothetical protein
MYKIQKNKVEQYVIPISNNFQFQNLITYSDIELLLANQKRSLYHNNNNNNNNNLVMVRSFRLGL